MKSNKIISLLVIVMLLLTVFAGCRIKNKSYPFEQDQENIEKVEICQYDLKTDTITPIVSLNENDYTSLLNEVSELELWRPGVDMPQGYGKIIIYITYNNEEAEILGSYRTLRVDTNGKKHMKPYYFGVSQWNDLLSKYVENIDDYL